jgi:hypothetical protein
MMKNRANLSTGCRTVDRDQARLGKRGRLPGLDLIRHAVSRSQRGLEIVAVIRLVVDCLILVDVDGRMQPFDKALYFLPGGFAGASQGLWNVSGKTSVRRNPPRRA